MCAAVKITLILEWVGFCKGGAGCATGLITHQGCGGAGGGCDGDGHVLKERNISQM